MAWSPPPPEPPARGWWSDLETAEQFETRRWIEGIAADLQVERIERLRALAHRVETRCSGALQADQWEQIQRRRDQRHTVSHGGYQIDSWGFRPVVEHSGTWGEILDVR